MQRRTSVFELRLQKAGLYIMYSVLVPISGTALTFGMIFFHTARDFILLSVQTKLVSIFFFVH